MTWVERLRTLLRQRDRSRRTQAERRLEQVSARTERVIARLEALGVNVEVIRREGP